MYEALSSACHAGFSTLSQIRSPALRFLRPPNHPVLSPRTAPVCKSKACEAVVILFQTTITIPDYYGVYGRLPSNASTIAYTALRDGSLIAPPLMHEAPLVAANLILSGIFLLIAIRNAIVSASFVWRIKIKKKGIFYALFASQSMGLLMLCVKLYSTFRPETSCAM